MKINNKKGLGQIQFVVSLVLIGLFSIAIIAFAINFAADNNSPISVDDDAELSGLYTDVQGNLDDYDEAAEDTYSSILNTTVSPESGTAQSAAPFAITPTSALSVVTNILFVAYQKIFGTGGNFAIFLVTFIGVLVFIVGFLVYKALRGLPN